MKRSSFALFPHRFGSSLTVATLVGAMIFTGLPRISYERAYAAPGVARQPRTDFDLYPINVNGEIQSRSGGMTWEAQTYEGAIGFNLARVYSNAASKFFVLLINGNTGAAKVFTLNNNGSLGSEIFTADEKDRQAFRCTSADVINQLGVNYLVTHDAFTGRVRSFPFYDNGLPNLGTTTSKTHDDWRDKNLFGVYSLGGNFYQLGLDTWTGDVLIHQLQGAQVTKTQWTRGWTNIDHLAIGAKTYRILYKSAGNPYLKNGDNEAGRTVIEEVGANGTGKKIFDQPLMPGFTSVRFVAFFASSQWQYRVIFFNRANQLYRVHPFTASTGLGAFIHQAQLLANNAQGALPSVDVEPYAIGASTFLAMTSDDNAQPFTPAAAEAMGHNLHLQLQGRVVGYQFMLSQSGRVIFSRGWGNVQLGDAPLAMSTRTRMDAGSVSKMLTTMSVLQLSAGANGQTVNLNDAVVDHVAPTQIPGDSWARTMNVGNLLTYNTGVKGRSTGEKDEADPIAPACTPITAEMKMDCEQFFAAPQSAELLNPDPDNDGNVTNDYRYNYTNSNFVAARKVIEHTTGIETSAQLTDKTFELWAKRALLDQREMSCQHRNDVYYFARCNGAEGCVPFEGTTWQQSKIIDGWSTNCAAGGWAVSSRHLLEFLRAVRYQSLLPDAEQLYLTSTELTSGGKATAVGWERPWSFDSDGDGTTEKYLSKGGANGDDSDAANGDGTSAAAFNNKIVRLPNNMDAVLMINTAGADSDIVFDAYKNAFDPAAYPLSHLDADKVEAGELATKVALNEGASHAYLVNHDYVTASRRDDGKLRLIAWETDLASGRIERSHDVTDLKINDVAISDGMDFVTAVRDTQDKLRVTGWINSAFDLTRQGETVGHKVSELAVTKARSTGTTGVAVTATINEAGKVQIDGWKFDHSADTVTLGGTQTLSAGKGVTIKTLKYLNHNLANTYARVVVAFRGGDGALWVYLYDVTPGGGLVYKGAKSFGSVANIQSARRIAIDVRGDGSDFFNGDGFLIGMINGEGNLQVTSWRAGIGEPDFVSKKGEAMGDALTSLDMARATTAIRRDSANLKLSRWSIDAQGGLSLLGETQIGDVNQVVAAGNVVTAYRNASNELKLINWLPQQ